MIAYINNVSAVSVVPVDPCNPDPCGVNANCEVVNGYYDCTCRPGYFGNPFVSCKPECIINSDCPLYLTCINNKCIDLCPGSCGVSAHCNIINHEPKCTCPRGYEGNPQVECLPCKYPP